MASSSAVMTSIPQFSGLRSTPSTTRVNSQVSIAPMKRKAMGVRCDFIATAGLKLEGRDSGLQTGDPAGFTLADTLACGSFGHIIGVGVVLGLKQIGAL
ncbi:hypothetical protein MKW94_016750 [Papaver nudicaule]|uniref:PSI-K n=1 Tax=Papaver nudicaule TaxID=74823 RepID=A0AA41VN92_PAPNU|nr:hypothetical protein [Papaver nudicaule]